MGSTQDMGVDKLQREQLNTEKICALLELLGNYLELNTDSSCNCAFLYGEWYYAPHWYHIYFTLVLCIGSKCKKHRIYWNKSAFIIRVNTNSDHTTEDYQLVCNATNHPDSIAASIKIENDIHEAFTYRDIVYDALADEWRVMERLDANDKTEVVEMNCAA